MILKYDNLMVTIGDTVFREKLYRTPQFVFDPDALQGFFDGVSVKRNEVTRPNQWGDFREPGLLGPRHISLTGAAVADNATQLLLDLRDPFTSMLAHGEYVEISVSYTDNTSNPLQPVTETRYITVTLEGTPSFVQKTNTTAVFKLDLYAPDPRMYGIIKGFQITDTTVNGGVDYPMDYPVNYGGGTKVQAEPMTNDGNTHAWPTFVVTGNFYEGFSVSNNAGSLITYEGIVTMSAPVTIDTARGTATQNGVDKSTMLSRRDWFSIPPNGGKVQPTFSPIQDGLGWCDIIYRDTWI